MGFSYTTSSPGARDKVRLLIGDTSSGDYVFEDAELDMFLSLWDQDVQLSAAQALRSLAADKAKMAIYYSVNGFSLNRTAVAEKLMALADVLEKRAVSTPFEYESLVEDLVDEYGRDRGNYPDTESEE